MSALVIKNTWDFKGQKVMIERCAIKGWQDYFTNAITNIHGTGI